MGFVRHDPQLKIWQSDINYALHVGNEFFIINVARDPINPRAQLWLKYDDNVPIDIDDMLTVAKITKDRFEKGEKTLIHCAVGVHRSVTFTLASIMYTYGVKIKEAMNMLCEPCINFDIYTHEIPSHFLSLQDFYIAYIK